MKDMSPMPISVHLTNYPTINDYQLYPIVERRMVRLQQVAGMVRSLRSNSLTATSVKVPLKSITLVHFDSTYLEDIKHLEKILQGEVNAVEIIYKNQKDIATYEASLNLKIVGPKFKKQLKLLQSSITQINQHILCDFYEQKIDTIEIANIAESGVSHIILTREDFSVKPNINFEKSTLIKCGTQPLTKEDNGLVVMIDDTYDEKVKLLHYVRLIATGLQGIRKESKLRPWDNVKIFFEADLEMTKLMEEQAEKIFEIVRTDVKQMSKYKGEKIICIGNVTVDIHIIKVTFTEL